MIGFKHAKLFRFMFHWVLSFIVIQVGVTNANADIIDHVHASQPVAFVSVNVVTMSNEQVLTNQTVLVNQGRIIEIGSAGSVDIGQQYTIIEGEGLFLSPGLGDSHTHLGAEVGVAGGVGENQLMVYLANGVTSIINQGDFLSPFGQGLMSLRDRISNNELAGPTIYTASYARGERDTGAPGQILMSFEDGVNHVRQSAAASYDFIKIYNYTPNEAVDGIFSEASKLDMAVLGHFPTGLSAQQTLDKGLDMVSHSAAFYWQFFGYQNDPNLVHQALQMTLDSQVTLSTTLFIEETIPSIWGGNLAAFEAFVAQDEMRYAHPAEIQVWRNGAEGARWNPSGSSPGQLDVGRDFIRNYITTFFDSGVKFVAGTDSPTVLGAPGFSTHHELDSIKRLGLSNFDVLSTATVNIGEFVAQKIPDAELFGQVIINARADLILTRENPLLSLASLKNREGVMANGNWYSASYLEQELEKVAADYQKFREQNPRNNGSSANNTRGGGALSFGLFLLGGLVLKRHSSRNPF
jgi:hypothetical protein